MNFNQREKQDMHQKHPWVISFDNGSNAVSIVEKRLVCSTIESSFDHLQVKLK